MKINPCLIVVLNGFSAVEGLLLCIWGEKPVVELGQSHLSFDNVPGVTREVFDDGQVDPDPLRAIERHLLQELCVQHSALYFKLLQLAIEHV